MRAYECLGDSAGSSAGAIAGGVIGGIIAVVVIVVTICIVAYCKLSVYKQKKGIMYVYIVLIVLLSCVSAENNKPSTL